MGFTIQDKIFIKMFASQQRLCSRRFLQDVSGQWTDNC